MALHIQMSDDALRKLKRAALLGKLISFGICAGFMLLFGSILYFTILIIQGEVPAEFIAYQPPAEDGPPTNNPVQKELTSKHSTTTPTVTPSVIVAQNAVGAVAAPVSLDTTGELDFEMDMNLDMDMDLGEGLGSDGGGLGSSTAGGSALEGTFYDLKMTRGGAPSKIANVYDKDKNGRPLKDKNGKFYKVLTIQNDRVPEGVQVKPNKQQEVMNVLSAFFKSKWNRKEFAPYYESKQKLYASNFYLPMGKAEYAPIAYKCADVCQDSGWVCVYRGRVRAPKTGTFRFIGVGDDLLAVRFNGNHVLEAGYRLPTLVGKEDFNWWVSTTNPQARDKYWAAVKSGVLKEHEEFELIPFKELPKWNAALGGLTAGKSFKVVEGKEYPIEILISEIPGGGFGFFLFIEDITNGKAPRGSKYDVFRTNFLLPDKKEIQDMLKKENCLFGSFEAPSFNEDSLIWTAVP